MSDSVIRLKIDSKEYDANIKRAGQALTDTELEDLLSKTK
jgi:hypothetical protein